MQPSRQSTARLDLALSAVNEYAVSLSGSLSLRIYADARPFNKKIADLQKGLVLVYNGKELVGEGTGFGFPVALYSKETYFPGSSRVFVGKLTDRTMIKKEFIMNRVKRNRFANVNLENRKARRLVDYVGLLYREHRRLRLLWLKGLVNDIGIQAGFLETEPVGIATVTYAFHGPRIEVKTDFTGIRKDGLKRLFVLNEQGADFFRVYSDSSGRKLVDDQIGAWDFVDAEWASLTDLRGKVGFRLGSVALSRLRRGRERLGDSLDWVGLDYEVSIRKPVFEYEIEVLGV